ncbi:MAG: hypothetical protein LUD22_02645 [Coprobacillus sp.]|nr:hypothetical protein [Coprobacillus sp.]
MDDENLNSEELETKADDSDKTVITEEAKEEVTPKKKTTTKAAPKEEAPVEEAPKEEVTEPVSEEVAPEETVTEEPVAEETPVVEGAAVVAATEELPDELATDVAEGLSKAKPVEYEGAVDDLDVVEQDRQDILKRYKKQNRWSYVIMIAVLVLVVAGFVLVVVQSSSDEDGSRLWMMILGYVLIGVGIVGMIIQYIFNRRRLPKRVDAYAAKAIDIFNAYNYSNPAYSKVYYDELEKVEPSEILADRVYYNVSDTKSQAVVRGSFGDAVFKSANVCVMIQGEKKKSQETVFLGRYITYPNSLNIDNRIILNFKGVKPIDLPTDTMDLVKLEDSDLFTVYGPEGASYKKLLGSKFISALQKIEVSGSLLNMNVVVWAGHTAVYMTYVDEFVSIPYQEPVNKDYYAKGRDDIFNVLTALKIINK